MNFVKKNFKWIITMIGVIIVTTGISVYATGQYLASQVDYNKNGQEKVSDALDDLYSKVPSGTIPITTKDSQIDVGKYQYADTTGLYTADEVQSGKGTSWNTGTFTSVAGENTISVGFTPTKILIIKGDETGSTLIYDSRISTTKFWIMGATLHEKRNISASITSFGFRSIGTTTKVYIAGAGSTFYWFATK